MRKLVLPLLVSVALFSCKKEDPDTQKPVISSVSVNGLSTASLSVSAGSSLSFEIGLSDNIELKQVKIDIHDAFDGHHHAMNIPFSSQTIYNISGTSLNFTTVINVPSDAAAGPYHIEIYCIDGSGNEAISVERELSITQSGQAVINVTSPDLSAEVDVIPGDTIHLAGTVTDDIDIATIDIHLENEDLGSIVFDQAFTLSGSSDTLWNFSEVENQGYFIILPAGITGHHHLRIAVTNSDNNMTVVEQHVHVY